MWFRRADADELRGKARRFRHMAIDDDDTPVSARLLRIAADLDARAEEIELGDAALPTFIGRRLIGPLA
jgi:hypothetical protein